MNKYLSHNIIEYNQNIYWYKDEKGYIFRYQLLDNIDYICRKISGQNYDIFIETYYYSK